MPRLPLPSTLEHEFLLDALADHSIRVDGRSLLSPRELFVSFGSTYGSVDVSLGATRVSVQASAEIVKPRDDRPYEGFLVVHNEISPIAGNNYESSGRCVNPSCSSNVTCRHGHALDVGRTTKP